MSTEKYTIEALLKKKLDALREIATGLSISFTDATTKKELAEAIIAEEAKIEAEANAGLSEEEIAEKKATEEAAEEAAKEEAAEEAAKEEVTYTLPETSKGVIDIGGKRYDRASAIKNQELLARLKKAGHKAIVVVKK